MPELRDTEQVDLRTRLLVFWLGIMDDGGLDPAQRIKASEMVAKYGLEGHATSKVPSVTRPTTADILRELDGFAPEPLDHDEREDT